jgi:hypothetical protein
MLIGARSARRVRHTASGGGGIRPPAGAPVILVNQSSDKQTIIGWSGAAQIGDLSAYHAEVIDRAVNELGLNAVRLQYRSGQLRNNDYYADWANGTITDNQERVQRFAPQTGTNLYKGGFVTQQMDNIVGPLRTALAARGETLHINLTLTDYPGLGDTSIVSVNAPSGTFDDDEAITWSGGSGQLSGKFNASSTQLEIRDSVSGSLPGTGVTITGSVTGVTAVTTGAASAMTYRGDYLMRANPSRVAELTLAVLAQMQTNYGYLPDFITIMNEPEAGNAGWSSAQLASAIKVLGDALVAGGYSIPIAAPSTTRDHNAASWFTTVWDHLPGSGYPNRAYVDYLAYHRYGNNLLSDTKTIASTAAAAGVQTAMTEWGISTTTGATGDTLHLDLKWGEVSYFEQFAIAFGGYITQSLSDKSKYFGIDYNDAVPATAVLTNNESKKFQQYFRFIRGGAVRKVTSHTDCGTPDATNEFYDYDGLAFRNTNGKYVVVVRTRATGDPWIDGLPAGTYGIEYTVGTNWHQTKADVTISTGDALTFNVASSTVSYWTIFQR